MKLMTSTSAGVPMMKEVASIEVMSLLFTVVERPMSTWAPRGTERTRQSAPRASCVSCIEPGTLMRTMFLSSTRSAPSSSQRL